MDKVFFPEMHNSKELTPSNWCLVLLFYIGVLYVVCVYRGRKGNTILLGGIFIYIQMVL